MSTELKAALKAAIWALVARYGSREAKRIIGEVVAGIDADDWSGPGNR